MDPQQQLSRALQERNLQSFEEAIRSNANPKLSDESGLNIYEKALATAGCVKFISLCLKYACGADYINKNNKAAINFACDSRDSENVSVLLEHKGVQVDNKYNGLTPLNSLAKNLNSDNATQVMECMRLLLRYGASPNIRDESKMSPLHYVLINRKLKANQKQELINLLVYDPKIDLDDELRADLLYWNPNLVLNSITIPQPLEVSIDKVLSAENMEVLKILLQNCRAERSDIIRECIESGKHEYIDYLLKDNFDINGKSVNDNKTCVELAVVYGNWYILKKLLQHKDIKLDNLRLLHLLIGRLDERPQKSFSDYVECFHLLLDSKLVDVNEKDKSERTPLHYAVLFNHEYAVKELLRHGAYLGTLSSFKELTIENIHPKLLEQHFDDCITSEGTSRADADFKIILDYRNLKQLNNKGLSEFTDMEPIYAMSKSKNLRHLLDHPLITTLIHFKWKSISSLFLMYLGTSIIFSIILLANTFFYSNYDKTLLGLLKLLSWIICIAYFIVCEAFTIKITKCSWPMSRFLNLSFIFLSILSNILSCTEFDHDYRRIIAAFAILFIAVKITRLMGSVPYCSLSIYVLMLREVCYTFLKSCIPYSILVVSFGLSFIVLNFHNLSEIPISEAIMKIIVMATGEFNENDIKFKQLFLNRLFFSIFVVFISIVLMNLLSALAFSDTQAIQASAKVNSLVCMVHLLTSYEKCHIKSWGFLKTFRWPIVNIPDTLISFPNVKEAQNIRKQQFEMKPILKDETEQLNINMPKEYLPIDLRKSVIKSMLQLIDQKSEKKHSITRKLESIENLLINLQSKNM